MAKEKKKDTTAAITHFLTAEDFLTIRVLALTALVIFGIVEFYGNQEMFHGFVMIVGVLFLALALFTSLAALKLGRSTHPEVKAAALRGESISLPIAAIVCGIWYIAGTNHSSALARDEAYDKRFATYQKSEDKAAEERDLLLKRHANCQQAAWAVKKSERAELMQPCDQILAGLSGIKATAERPTAPPSSAADVAYEWKFWIRILNLVALGVTTCIISRLIYLSSTAQVQNPEAPQGPEPVIEGGSVQNGGGGWLSRLVNGVQKSRGAARAQNTALAAGEVAKVQNVTPISNASVQNSEHANLTVKSDSEQLQISRVRLEHLGSGFYASRDNRKNIRGEKYKLNRFVNGLGTRYLIYINGAELRLLQDSSSEFALAWLDREMKARRQNDIKLTSALEALAAA